MSQLPPLPSVTPAQPRRRGPFLILVLVFAVLIAAGVVGWRLLDDADAPVGPVPGARPSMPMPSTPPALDPFYDQKLDWSGCGPDECAHLTVPLDYADPGGETIKLAVLRVEARKESLRIGALVVNPGGPGASGTEYASGAVGNFGPALSNSYDIVGFDPRGVGSSDPLHCLDTADLDTQIAADPDPDDAAELAESDRLVVAFGQGCLDRSGDLARHISTEEAARDMDVLRAALGEPRLDYLGASYGTFLGATYADLFPKHVGRFVLDGAIDPSVSSAEQSLVQAGGFETALRAYVASCVDAGSCFLGDSVDAGTQRIRALLDQLDQAPLTTGSTRQLTEGLAMIGIWLPLYSEANWPLLTSALKEAIDQRTGDQLLFLADSYSSRGADAYTDNSIEALYAINCLDHGDSIPTSQVPSHYAEFEKVSPTFGRAFALGLSTCENWPIKSGKKTTVLHAKGAPPIVVIGTTRDPATPLVWAEGLAKQLRSGRLITRDGDGHTGFRRGNACVDDAVEAWLIQGTAPPKKLNC